MSTKLLNNISAFTGLNQNDIESIVNTAPFSYKVFSIPKKSSGSRTIAQPNRETKAIQYALLETFFYTFELSQIATAYIRDSNPLVKNVKPHVGTKYSLKTDFTNFFPSIKPIDLFQSLSTNYDTELNEFDRKILSKICFRNNSDSLELSIGAPTSPVISNIVMYTLDEKILHLKNDVDSDGVVTRYADDLTFSTNHKKTSNTFLKGLENLLNNTPHPSLTLNSQKTCFLSKKNNRTITGLVITSDDKISIGRSRKRYIQTLVYNFQKGNLDEESINHLRGLLGFVNDVEPIFFNRLITKYGAETLENIKKMKKTI